MLNAAARDVALACEAWLVALRVKRMLAVRGLAESVAWAETVSVAALREMDNDVACRMGRVVNLTCRFCVMSSTCLTRSLTLKRLFTRRGVPSQLKIGIRIEEAKALAAHAWLEVNGAPVNDRSDIAADFHVVPLDEALKASTFIDA